jgi:hypothetical protein
LDKYFDYEDIDEEKKVKHAMTILKGHATLWWDELQADRRCKGNLKIKSWDRIVGKLKDKLIPKDYQINILRKLQNLVKKGFSMKEYTKEFYKLNIRGGHRENDEEKVSKYINGLRYEIQDEINMMKMKTIEDAYQVSLNEEYKLNIKKIQRNRGKNPNKGRGMEKEKFQKPGVEVGKYYN